MCTNTDNSEHRPFSSEYSESDMLLVTRLKLVYYNAEIDSIYSKSNIRASLCENNHNKDIFPMYKYILIWNLKLGFHITFD